MSSNIWVAAADNEIETVKSHLNSGMSANAQDPNGYTPIHAAASYGHLDLLRLLIAKGGNINIQDNEGDTPLHHIEDVEVAKVLVEEFKADWKIKNNDGQTAAEYIEEDDEFPDVVQYLKSLAHDQAPSEVDKEEESFIASLPQPGTVDGHQIRYTLEEDPNTQENGEIGINIMGDEEKRKKLEAIMNSENPEEGMRELLSKAMAEGLSKFNSANSGTSEKKEREILIPKGKRRKEDH